jgi:hypothetical protein
VAGAASHERVLLQLLGVEPPAAHLAGPVGPVIQPAQRLVDRPQFVVQLVEQGGVGSAVGGVGHIRSVVRPRRDTAVGGLTARRHKLD